MPVPSKSTARAKDWKKTRDDWIGRLSSLFDDVQVWAGPEWTPRRFDTELEEPEIGKYTAPVLLMQKGTTRIQLEPIARFGVGCDGVVDLYRMPAYDDIATVLMDDDTWRISWWRKEQDGSGEILESYPLSKDSFRKLLARISRNGQHA